MIKEVFWEITNICNARCVHCSVTNNKNGKVINSDRKKILEKLVDAGVDNITITGGEPTQVDLKGILSDFPLDKLFLRVCTNGLHLDEELLKFFNKNSIGYNVSFHSLDAKTGKEFYGVDVSWVLPLIDMLLDKGKKDLFALNSAVLSLNLHELPDIANYLNERPENIRKWRILNPIEAGNLLKNRCYVVNPEEIRDLKKRLDSMGLSYPVLVNSEERSTKPCKIEERKEVYITQYGTMRPCLGLTYLETQNSLLTHGVDELLAEPVMDFWVSKYGKHSFKSGKCIVSKCSPDELKCIISEAYK